MSLPIDVQKNRLCSVDQFPVDPAYRSHLEGILISEGEISSRVDRIAEELAEACAGQKLVAICMLDGALHFFDALVYNLHALIPVAEIETLKAKSYSGKTTTGSVTFSGFDFSKARGRDVLVVEDIVDTGTTIQATLDHLKAHDTKSITLAALFAKPDRHQPGLKEALAAIPSYIGFLIPNEFVVGYGLDFNGSYRGLRHLGILKEEAFQVAQPRR